MKRITFILPGLSRYPSGGYKVIYQYANMFANNDYHVTIVHDISNSFKRAPQIKLLKILLGYALNFYYPNWFNLSDDVTKCVSYGIDNTTVPKGDYVIATAIQTAKSVSELDVSKGKKIYFIQGFEAWDGYSEADVLNTYRLGMKNIVISKWLLSVVESVDNSVCLVPNFIDTQKFYITTPIQKRNPYEISMLYSKNPVKGTEYGLAVLRKLKIKYPQLTVRLFGTEPYPDDIDEWMEYYYNASEDDLRKIYNLSAIYMYPAISDGWGLTGMESMACGCAYLSTDYGGQREYTYDNDNVMLSKARDIEGMYQNACILIENSNVRFNLAKSGSKNIKENFSLDKSFKIFNNILKESFG